MELKQIGEALGKLSESYLEHDLVAVVVVKGKQAEIISLERLGEPKAPLKPPAPAE